MHLSKLRSSFLSILVVILGLVGPLVISTTVAAQEAKTTVVGKQVVNGMAIAVELEVPKVMQMMMKGMGEMGGMGEWKTFRPKPGALTHHLTVILTDPETREQIPYASVSGTIINAQTKAKMTKKLPPMFGQNLIYGVNIRLEPGKYQLILTVEPPTLMRVEGAINKWLRPIQAKFSFDVK